MPLPQWCILQMKLLSVAGGGASPADVRPSASAADPGGPADGVDLLLAWEAASPLDDAPCRGYSHLYGMRPQVGSCPQHKCSEGYCPRSCHWGTAARLI